MAFVAVATAAAALLYLNEFHSSHLVPWLHLPANLHRDVAETGRSIAGTPLGLIYGSVAAAIFVFAALLGLRRKRPTLKVGRLQTWLKGHIWLTLLTVPLILFHAGFSAGSAMTTWLLVLYGIVMVSGVYGLALQQFLPRLMEGRVPLETVFEQIPHVRARLHASALELRSTLDPEAAPALSGAGAVVGLPDAAAAAAAADDASLEILQRFADDAVLPYLAAHSGDKLLLGSQRVSDEQFRLVKISVAPEWQAKVEQLQAWCDERRQLDLQTKLQHWLHGWLLVHVPLSVLLLIYTAWHAVAALYFY